MKDRVLILGIGNYLMGDEGLGVHLARELHDELHDEHIDIIDGGTGGFQLMELMETYPVIILIDATLERGPIGSIRLIEPKFSSDFPKAMSTHEIGLKDLVESLTLLGKLPKIYLFVVSIEKVQPLSIELSLVIATAVIELKKKVVALAKSESKKILATA